MRAYRVLASLLVLSAATGITDRVHAQPVPYEDLKDLYRAPIIVTYDPAVFPLNSATMGAVLNSEQFSQRLKSAVEGTPPRMMLQFSPLGEDQSPGRLAGSLWIMAAESDAEAMKVPPYQLWQAVLEELEDTLSETAKRLERRHEEQWSLQRDFLLQKRDDVNNQLEKALHAVGSVQMVDIADSLEKLSSKKHDISFQLAGVEARRQALQDRIDELQNGGATAGIDREIIEQLEQVVAFHEQKLKMLQGARASKAAQVAQSEVMEAEAELAKARIDLLRAKKEAAATSSPELAALSEELTEATITAAEQRAILQAVESRIEELKQAAAEEARQMQAAQEAEHRAAILREQLATVEKRLSAMELERLERQARRGGTVTIVPWSVPAEDD